MVKLKLIGVILLVPVLAFAWTDVPPGVEGAWVGISRVVTSVTGISTNEPLSDEGWDHGDDDPAITQEYGGAPFAFGKPMQIEIVLSPPPPDDAWALIRLEYYQGTNTTSAAWELIRERTTTLGSIIGVPGTHLGLLWTPPAPGHYLIRVLGVTAAGLYTGLPTATGITAKGDGLSWKNHAVVGVQVEDRTRPSYRE